MSTRGLHREVAGNGLARISGAAEISPVRVDLDYAAVPGGDGKHLPRLEGLRETWLRDPIVHGHPVY